MAITSSNLPKIPPAPGASAPVVDKVAVVTDEPIEARPLTMPDFINLQPKDQNLRFRWINFKVGKDESTLRYEQALAQGFQNATVDDIKGIVPDAYKREAGKRIVNGDVILMKISRRVYDGALLHKDQQAMKLAAKTDAKARGVDTVSQTVKATGAPAEIAKLVRPFAPSEAEVSGLVGKD